MQGFRIKILRPAGVVALVIFSLGILVICIFFLFSALGAISNLASLRDTASTRRSIAIILTIAFLTMALLQALRSALPVRGWFHSRQLRRHFIATEVDIDAMKEKHGSKEGPKKRAEKSLEKLLDLANAANEITFFNLPLEQVCGQISAVAELLLGELAASPTYKNPQAKQPEKYLLTNLAGRKGARDALELFQVFHINQPSVVEELRERVAYVEELRERVAYHVQRNIDQLQIAIRTTWQRWLRLFAIAISSAIAIKVIAPHSPDGFAQALVVGLVAGYVATIFRDATAILERLRR